MISWVPVRKRSRLRQMESSVYALEMVAGSLQWSDGREGCGLILTYWVFQVSCAFFTLALAVSAVNGGASDMIKM